MRISDPGSGVGESAPGPVLSTVPPGLPPPSKGGTLGAGTKTAGAGSAIPATGGITKAGGADGVPSGIFDVAGGAAGVPPAAGDPAVAPGLPGVTGLDDAPPGVPLPPASATGSGSTLEPGALLAIDPPGHLMPLLL